MALPLRCAASLRLAGRRLFLNFAVYDRLRQGHGSMFCKGRVRDPGETWVGSYSASRRLAAHRSGRAIGRVVALPPLPSLTVGLLTRAIGLSRCSSCRRVAK
jgi:hypothetical protein